MIAALALSLALQTANPVSELIDPDAKYVSVQVIVKLPPLSGHERAEAEIMAETMADEVEGYGRRDMREMAGRAGDMLRITLMPDHLRIQMGVLPADVKPALGYLNQILRTSRLPLDSITRAIDKLPLKSRSLWETALQPTQFKFSRIRREDIVELYQRICRPENVWLSVGGQIEPGVAGEFWDNKNKDWTPDKLPRPSLDQAPAPVITGVPGRESMVELRGKDILGSDAALPTRILAIIAIGSGKGSAMFERLREGRGWSYRQESVLWPTLNGFAPRMIMASGDKTPLPELAEAMKKELIDAVKGWTDADLRRARGMAEGILTRGVEMSPFYFNSHWPIDNSLHDQTFIGAYWLMKTGRPWEPQRMLAQMALVPLAELKEAALEILNGAEPFTITASG